MILKFYLRLHISFGLSLAGRHLIFTRPSRVKVFMLRPPQPQQPLGKRQLQKFGKRDFWHRVTPFLARKIGDIRDTDTAYHLWNSCSSECTWQLSFTNFPHISKLYSSVLTTSCVMSFQRYFIKNLLFRLFSSTTISYALDWSDWWLIDNRTLYWLTLQISVTITKHSRQ